MKKCSICNEVKDDSCFSKCKNHKDGLRSECKSCNKDYNESNKDRIRDYHKNLGETYKEKCKEKNKIWVKSNKERVMLNHYKISDKKKGLVCDLTVDWIKTNITSKNCTYCIDETKDLGCDRIDNNKGHTMDNCVPCCSICNYARNDEFSFNEMLILGKTIREIKLSRMDNT